MLGICIPVSLKRDLISEEHNPNFIRSVAAGSSGCNKLYDVAVALPLKCKVNSD